MEKELKAWEQQLEKDDLEKDEMFRNEFRDQFKYQLIRDRKFYPEISIGRGWWKLFHDLCQEVRDVIGGPDQTVFQWSQIKEKFGILRAYCIVNDEQVWDKVDEIISRYEGMSAEICEICGEPGEPRRTGWVKTLCDKHYQERVKEHRKLYGLNADF